MTSFLEALTVIGALIGAGILALTLAGASGAPQEAAGAAIALCVAVIPYVLASVSHRSEVRRTMAKRD